MRDQRLSAGLYAYDDFQIGDWFETAEETITEELIDQFANLTGDRFAIHMDNTAARALGFERRVAHGLLILSLIDGLKNQTDIKMQAVASLGWEWRFSKPILARDTIKAIWTVTAKRMTRDPIRGIVTFTVDVQNQHAETVQSGTNNLMLLTRDASAQ